MCKKSMNKKLDLYLQHGTKESSMRLMSFMMVVVGCLGVICSILICFYQLFFKQTIDWTGLSLYITSCGGFSGIGLTGKYYQKRVENRVYGNPPEQPSAQPGDVHIQL